MGADTLLLAQAADRGQLRDQHGELTFHRRAFLVGCRVLASSFSLLHGLSGLGLVQVLAANRSVSQHCDALGLHFKDATSDKHQFFARTIGAMNTYRSWFDATDQRGVLGVNAQFTRLAGQHDEFCIAREYAFLGAHHIDVQGMGHFVSLQLDAPRGRAQFRHTA